MMRRPRFSKDEFMRRGTELYERIRPQVEEGNRRTPRPGSFVQGAPDEETLDDYPDLEPDDTRAGLAYAREA